MLVYLFFSINYHAPFLLVSFYFLNIYLVNSPSIYSVTLSLSHDCMTILGPFKYLLRSETATMHVALPLCQRFFSFFFIFVFPLVQNYHFSRHKN
uniref:Uncharacterized protein n=1 Tax=Rhipicephalus zambeziensis TaxID=60191 RepID=A0A224YGB1_9ACAR